MLISDLIKGLQYLKKKHGDIAVLFNHDYELIELTRHEVKYWPGGEFCQDAMQAIDKDCIVIGVVHEAP